MLRTTQDTCLDTEYERLQSKLVCYASSGVQSRGEGGHAFALPRPLILKVLHSLLCSTLPTPEACSFDKPTGEKKCLAILSQDKSEDKKSNDCTQSGVEIQN